MKNKLMLTLAAALVAVGNLVAQTPTALPVVVSTPPADITIRIDKIPVAVVEALRQQIVASGAFAFPADLEAHPLKMLMLRVNGTTASGMIVLGPVNP